MHQLSDAVCRFKLRNEESGMPAAQLHDIDFAIWGSDWL